MSGLVPDEPCSATEARHEANGASFGVAPALSGLPTAGDGSCDMGAAGSADPYVGLSDEELMGRLAAGEQDALRPLHGRYAALVFGVAAQTLDRATAEEIAQDVFVTIWRKAGKFDPARGAVRNWVLRIAHFGVLNELRRRGRRPRVEPDPEGARLNSAPAPGPGPVEEAWRAHRRTIIREAVEALPPAQRQALTLAFLEDLTHEQVACFLDLPLGTAKTRIRSGLQALRARLAPILAGGLVVIMALLILHLRNQSLLKSDALRMATSSDVVPLRLTSVPGVPAETHGQYRGRRGARVAILTVSHLKPPSAGRAYHAWGEFDGRWIHLGIVQPNEEGRDLLVVEDLRVSVPPTALLVTEESTRRPSAPASSRVMVWPKP